MNRDLTVWQNHVYASNAQDNAAASTVAWPLAAVHLLDRMDFGRNMDVLDVGTGPGLIAARAAARVAPLGYVTAIDRAEEMLEIARRRFAAEGLPVTVAIGDMHDLLEFPAESFDRVTAGLNIYLARDRVEVLRGYARVTRPGGRVGISSCGAGYFAPLGAEFRRIANAARPGVADWVPWDDTSNAGALADAFRAAGLVDVQADLEDIRVPIRNVDDFWSKVVQGTGFSRILDLLGDDAGAVRHDLAAYIDQHRITEVTFQVIYVVGKVTLTRQR